VELSHGIRITLVRNPEALGQGFIKVSSLHNFCPLPTGVMQAAPNLFEPSVRRAMATNKSSGCGTAGGRSTLRRKWGRRSWWSTSAACVFFWLNPARRLRDYARSHPAASPSTDPVTISCSPKPWRGCGPPAAVLGSDPAQRGRTPALRCREGRAAWTGESRTIRGTAGGCGFSRFLEHLARPEQAGYWHDTGHAE